MAEFQKYYVIQPARPSASPPSPLDSATDPSASSASRQDFVPSSSHHSSGHLISPQSRWALFQVHQFSAHLRRPCAQVRQTFSQVRRDLSQVKEHRHTTAGNFIESVCFPLTLNELSSSSFSFSRGPVKHFPNPCEPSRSPN